MSSRKSNNNLTYFVMNIFKAKPGKLNIDGIDISLTKKRIKNAYIYVKPPDGEVQMSIPYRMSLAEAERFVLSKFDWIKKNREKILSRDRNPTCGYKDGDTLYIWGKPFIIRYNENSGRKGYELDGIFVSIFFKGCGNEKEAEELIKKMYAELLKERLAVRLPLWEEKTGLKSSAWSVRYMTSRWGSCNTRSKKVNFNTQLAGKDPVFLEYVILHELAHIKVADHGERFKAILDRYMNDWRRIRKELI